MRNQNLASINSGERKYVNVDFFDWLQNKQLQTGLIINDQRNYAKKIVALNRK